MLEDATESVRMLQCKVITLATASMVTLQIVIELISIKVIIYLALRHAACKNSAIC